MTTKKSLTTIPEIAEAEAMMADASKQTGVMVQRLSSHRDKIDMAIKELESERFELISRRDMLRRQAEAVDAGFAMHLDDIEKSLALYERGMNSQTEGNGNG